MNAFKENWLAEERAAHMLGWDFSHISARYSEEENLPWDYRDLILRHLKKHHKLLDIDTGGGEFLLSLGHPAQNTSAMEAYPPNVELCRKKLLPMGIDFRTGDGNSAYPFENNAFDMVINRHGDFNPNEIQRVLKPGGLFITQQVGAENDRELVRLLLGGIPLPFPDQYLRIAENKFKSAGFEILQSDEAFSPIRFFDTGALVWFARIISWEFPGFSVEKCFQNLLSIHGIIEKQGFIEAKTHRFMLVARKPYPQVNP